MTIIMLALMFLDHVVITLMEVCNHLVEGRWHHKFLWVGGQVPGRSNYSGVCHMP
jgi:hypothetical protein